MDLEHVFQYHTPKEGQQELYEKIRAAGKRFAQVITECTPACADQTAAIRKVREAVFTANAAIALDGRLDEEQKPIVLKVHSFSIGVTITAKQEKDHGTVDK